MKLAYYPGCVALGNCPELYDSTDLVAKKLGLELVELTDAACCGAGVIQSENPELADTLNARTFAMAESQNLDIMVICSTCQGYLGKSNHKLKGDPAYLNRINENVAYGNTKDFGASTDSYGGRTEVKHLLWLLAGKEYGPQKLKDHVTRPLTGLKVGPFYGCHILRPSNIVGFEDPERPTSMDIVIRALGGEAVDYKGKTRCCGFPIILENEMAALRMIADNMLDAKRNGADCVVTPCPLCHMNLDLYQKKAEQLVKTKIEMPILHFSQLVGLGLGCSAKELKLHKHFVSCKPVVQKVRAAA